MAYTITPQFNNITIDKCTIFAQVHFHLVVLLWPEHCRFQFFGLPKNKGIWLVMDFRPIGGFVSLLRWFDWTWTIVQLCCWFLDRSWSIGWSRWFVVLFISWKSFWLSKSVMLFMMVLKCFFCLVFSSSSNSFRFYMLASIFCFRSLVMMLSVCCSSMVCFPNIDLSYSLWCFMFFRKTTGETTKWKCTRVKIVHLAIGILLI